MGARTYIGFLDKNNNNKITAIYSHWGAEIEEIGSALLNSVKTEEDVKKLLSLGDIRYSASNMFESTFFGDAEMSFSCSSKDEFTIESYNRCSETVYLFVDGIWYFGDLYEQSWFKLSFDLISCYYQENSLKNNFKTNEILRIEEAKKLSFEEIKKQYPRYFSSNPRTILGINSNTPKKMIKKIYFKLAKEFHPDTTNLEKYIAEEIFKSINNAYSRVK